MPRVANLSGLALNGLAFTPDRERPLIYAREQWIRWFHQHGINTEHPGILIAPGGLVAADDHARNITYWTFHAQPRMASPGQRYPGIHEARWCSEPHPPAGVHVPGFVDICVRPVVVQLEARALPMPDALPPWIPGPGAPRSAWFLHTSRRTAP